tara:strand:- start:213 stop:2723 length:2511 start_codon:yes stop_codon:yes gene_type:complete
MSNKYKRRSRGGSFKQQGQNLYSQIDRIRQQRQIEIDGLKTLALQQKEQNKEQISGIADQGRKESENRRILQDLETKKYTTRRRAIQKRSETEVANLQGQADELGREAQFWEKFATEYSQRIGKAAGQLTDYAQYRAAIGAYNKLGPEMQEYLRKEMRKAYSTVETDATGQAFQVLKKGESQNIVDGVPDFSSWKDAKEIISRTHGWFANNHHLWNKLSQDFIQNIEQHVKEVRQNSLDKNGKNMYNTANSGKLLMNYAYLWMAQHGIPFQSAAGSKILGAIRGQVGAEYEGLWNQEQYIKDDEKRIELGGGLEVSYRQYKAGEISEGEWLEAVKAFHVFHNGSVIRNTDGKYIDLAKRHDLTIKDRWLQTTSTILDYVKFDSQSDAEDLLNLPILDKNGNIIKGKKGPVDFLLDKHPLIRDSITEKLSNTLKLDEKRTENDIKIKNKTTADKYINAIEKDALDGNFENTLLNSEFMGEMYQAANGKQIKDTNHGYRLQQAMGYDPAKHGNNFEKFYQIRSEFLSGDINGALFSIIDLKEIPQGYSSIHESIKALRGVSTNVSKEIDDKITSYLAGKVKDQTAVKNIFASSDEVLSIMPIAKARFMDIFLDHADIQNPNLRFQKSLAQLKQEIDVGFDTGKGLFAVQKEKSFEYGFKFKYTQQELPAGEPLDQTAIKEMFFAPMTQANIEPIYSNNLSNVIETNIDKLVSPNQERALVTSFLQGTARDEDIPDNLTRFIKEAQIRFPNSTTSEIMNMVLKTILTNPEKGYAEGKGEEAASFYNDTTWPPNGSDLCKKITGVTTNNQVTDQILCLNKLAEDNGINLNKLLGDRWRTN